MLSSPPLFGLLIIVFLNAVQRNCIPEYAVRKISADLNLLYLFLFAPQVSRDAKIYYAGLKTEEGRDTLYKLHRNDPCILEMLMAVYKTLLKPFIELKLIQKNATLLLAH